jgi:hypothetical protein
MQNGGVISTYYFVITIYSHAHWDVLFEYLAGGVCRVSSLSIMCCFMYFIMQYAKINDMRVL